MVSFHLSTLLSPQLQIWPAFVFFRLSHHPEGFPPILFVQQIFQIPIPRRMMPNEKIILEKAPAPVERNPLVAVP